VRETLAPVADRAILMAREHRCGTIALEKGLGKLRSSGRTRSLNRLLNYWARTIFVAMLTRRARLAGITVIEVWARYSSTIGNSHLRHRRPYAPATEVAERGITRPASVMDVFSRSEGSSASLRKNLPLPSITTGRRALAC
jgi:IS605 OrfB family transposase